MRYNICTRKAHILNIAHNELSQIEWINVNVQIQNRLFHAPKNSILFLLAIILNRRKEGKKKEKTEVTFSSPDF